MQFSTEYFLRGTRYTTVLYAENRDEAEMLIHQRKMNEKLVVETFEAPEMTTDLIKQWRWADAMHSACWLGMVGCASGRVVGTELLDDQGLIHALSHLIRKPQWAFDKVDAKLCYLILVAYFQAIKIEKRVPGFIRRTDDINLHDYNKNFERKSLARENMYTVTATVHQAYPDWYVNNFVSF